MRHFTYSPLLGTTVKVAVDCALWRSETAASERVVTEMTRLSGVFNIYDPDSQISRFRRSENINSADLTELIALAKGWQEKSDGRFNPRLGTSDVDLNAIAKGWIVDKAAVAAGNTKSITIDAGGDVLSQGETSTTVGIQNPLRPYDNEPALATVTLRGQALATSGPAHRGGHLIDPRTGVPPTEVTSATAIADYAATADVVATILAIGSVREGLDFANQLSIGALLVDGKGKLHLSNSWPSEPQTRSPQ